MMLNRTLKWIPIVLCVLGGSGRATSAQTPSLALLVASQGKAPDDNALIIIDPVAKKVVGRVLVGGTPHDVAVSPDGRFAVTTNINLDTQWMNYPGVTKKSGSPDLIPEDSISVIDLMNQKLLRKIDVGPGAEPHGIT